MSGSADPHDDAARLAAGMGELGDLWRFGFETSQAMAARVLELYQGLPSGLGFGAADADTEAEFRRLRVDLERAVDLSVDVFERVLTLARRLGPRPDDGHGRGHDELVVRSEAGGSGTAELWIHNVSSASRPAPEFRCTGLADFDGVRIADEHVHVRSGDQPIVERNSRRVEVLVHVPPDAAPGTYHALVLARHPEASFRLRLEVTNGEGETEAS